MSKKNRKFPRSLLFSAFTAVCLTGYMGDRVEAAVQQQEEYQEPRFTISSNWSVAENAANFDGFVTVNAMDYDGGELTYGLDLTGHDAQLFHIDLQTGLLGFINPPEFNSPQDEDGDNCYNITLIACDSRGGCSEFQMSVRVQEAHCNPLETAGVPVIVAAA